MKKVLFLAAAALSAASAYAQKSNVNAAENALILQQFDKAKESIDEAMQNEKTKDFAKTYIVASEVYLQLANKGIDSLGLEKSKQFIEKAMELDKTGDAKGKGVGKFTKDINKKLVRLGELAENHAIQAYNAKNYNESKNGFLFELWAHAFAPDYNELADSSIIINVGLTSMQAEDWKTGAEYFSKAGQLRVGEAMSFLRAKYCYEQLKDSANVEKTLKAGFEAYPRVTDMINTLINYYLSAQKNDEALVYLNSAIAKDPNNAQYYFARGCLKEKINIDEAIADYKTAIEKDANSFGAIYNLGIVYYNQALLKKQDASNERDNDKYNAKMKDANDTFRLAIPYFERAANVAPDKANKREVLNNLKSTYYTIGEYGKNQEVQAQIDQLDAQQ